MITTKITTLLKNCKHHDDPPYTAMQTFIARYKKELEQIEPSLCELSSLLINTMVLATYNDFLAIAKDCKKKLHELSLLKPEQIQEMKNANLSMRQDIHIKKAHLERNINIFREQINAVLKEVKTEINERKKVRFLKDHQARIHAFKILINERELLEKDEDDQEDVSRHYKNRLETAINEMDAVKLITYLDELHGTVLELKKEVTISSCP